MSFTPSISLEHLRQAAAAFARERDWEQFHSPRSLLLALVSEVGEAAELVRWQADDAPPDGNPEAWAHELADILIFLVRLADVTKVDLPQAFLTKLKLAGDRYPADEYRGSARKYASDQ